MTEFWRRFFSRTCPTLLARLQQPSRSSVSWALPISGALWSSVHRVKGEELSPEAKEAQLFEETFGYPKPISNAHTAKWRTYTDTARDLFTQGRMSEAEKYFLQAIEEAKEGFGAGDPHVASSFNNLAELYRMRKEYDKAEPLYLEAVQLLEEAQGPENSSVAFALHNLGGFYLLQRKYDKAADCYQRALKIKGRVLGLNHSEYADTMFHLGKVMQLMGKLSEAEALIRKSIDIAEYGESSPNQSSIRRMVTLAEIFVQLQQLEEAENLQRKILQTISVLQGPESTGALIASENLGGTLHSLGKLDEAEELLKQCLEIRQKSCSSDDMQIWGSLSKLASVVMSRGEKLVSEKSMENAAAEYDKAETMIQQAIRIAESNWARSFSNDSKEKISMRTGRPLFVPYLLALVRSLNILGLIGIKRIELAEAMKRNPDKLDAAENGLRQCVSLLKQDGISQVASSMVEIVREQVNCTQRLASLLKAIAINKSDLQEVKSLEQQASSLNGKLNSLI